MLASVVVGLGGWLRRSVVLALLGVVGGVLLGGMGATTALGAHRAAVDTQKTVHGVSAPSSWRGPVASGFVLSLSNPYWLLWWCTIGLNYAALALQRGPIGLGAFYAGHIASDLVWYSAVSAAVSAGRRVCPPVVHRTVLIICGLVLVALGAWFLGDGAGRLNEFSRLFRIRLTVHSWHRENPDDKGQVFRCASISIAFPPRKS